MCCEHDSRDRGRIFFVLISETCKENALHRKKTLTTYMDFALLMRELLCPHSKNSLKCRVKKCPLIDAQLVKFVEHFLFMPRLLSLPFDVIRGAIHTKFRDLSYDLWVCLPDKARRAYHVMEFFYRFLDSSTNHKKTMNYQLCRDICTLRRRFDRKVRERD